MLSRFLHTTQIGNNLFAIYNSLVFEPVFVDSDERDNILMENISDDTTMETLFKKGIYIKSAEEDSLAEERMRCAIHAYTHKVKILYLIVSTGCNLLCRYCFIENNPMSTCNYSVMSPETAKIAIDKFFSQVDLSEKIDVIFYGGEPLTNWETVRYSISYIREKYGNTVGISIVTNGTLIDKEIAVTLSQNDVGIGISIDGPQAINDSNRVFRSNIGSVYDTVCEKIELLKKNQCKFGLSITVTKDVLENKKQVLDWIKQLKVESIFWNLFHFSSPSNEWASYYEEMAEFILDSHDVLDKHGVTDSRIQDLLELFADSTFRYESCGALGLNQIAVTPNGDVCICQGDSRDVSKVAGNILYDSISDIINSDIASQWENLLTIDRQECLECEALFVCGGGCPAHSEVLFGSRNCVEKASCIFYRNYLRWVLKKYYEMEVEQHAGDSQ